MTATLKWSRADKVRAQTILKKLADAYKGWQGLADELGMKADSSRATVQAWHRRGRVSFLYAGAVAALATTNGTPCTAGDICPQAKHLEKTA